MSREQIVKRRLAKIKAGGYKEEKVYRKTFKGYMVSSWNNMQSRVSGKQKEKYHLYQGLGIMTKDEFYEFTRKSTDYYDLFVLYILSGYDRKYAPSVDRIDPTKGYTAGNIRWVSLSQNCKNTRRWQS